MAHSRLRFSISGGALSQEFENSSSTQESENLLWVNNLLRTALIAVRGYCNPKTPPPHMVECTDVDITMPVNHTKRDEELLRGEKYNWNSLSEMTTYCLAQLIGTWTTVE